MSKLIIVSKIRVNGNLYLQDEIDPKEFRDMADKKITEVMEGIGYTREKTA